MPYPSEHAARVQDPGKFTSFVRKEVAPGVTIILGIKDGKSSVQAYRFDKTKFTAAEAREWLKKHEVNFMSFEPAVNTEMNKRIRG